MSEDIDRKQSETVEEGRPIIATKEFTSEIVMHTRGHIYTLCIKQPHAQSIYPVEKGARCPVVVYGLMICRYLLSAAAINESTQCRHQRQS